MSIPTVRRPADQHVTSVHRPVDFDAFWREILDESARTPLNPSVGPVSLRSTAEVETFDIHYDSIDGVRVAGWYCRPRAEFIAPPYPALLIMPGYISEPTLPKSWAKLGFAAIGVAPRGKLPSNRQYNPGYPGLLVDNIVDRNTYAYRGFYIDAIRAVDFAQSRPEIDGSRIGVHGGSQGGALTVVTAALRPEAIACGAAGAPYLCGFMDAASLTHSHPYEEINEYLREYPEREPLVRETVAYFDGINFAPWITCPMLVTLGLNDDVCPPETGFDLVKAMVNSPVRVNAYERCAHDAGSYWDAKQVLAFLIEHLQPSMPGQGKGEDA
jgi:cephalosporin-C deacetylase